MISIPKLTFSDIAKFYSLIRVSHMGIASPIECINDNVQRSWQAPMHPTEMGIFTTDTIYEEPKSITINAFVKNSMFPVFEAQILLSTKIGFGFNIFTIGGVYNNMFVTSLDRPETADVSTGYNISVTFTELQNAGSLLNLVTNLAINVGSSVIAAAVNTVDSGTVLPSAKDGASEAGGAALSGALGFL